MDCVNFSSHIEEKSYHKAGDMRSLILLSILIWIFSVGFSPCYGKEAAAEEGELNLSLRQCIELMLVNNLDLEVERYNPYLQDREIVKEKAAFDPLARFSFQDSKMVVSPTSLLNGIFFGNQSYEQETIDYEFSLACVLP